jgi:prepilin-type N-terminal cleavage/methylation domain-containing protein
MNRHGFTLLEVLISIMILAMGIVAVLPLFAVGTQSHKRALDQTHTSLIAPRIAARIQENLTQNNPADIKDGLFVEYGRVYRYDAVFTPMSTGDPLSEAAFLLQVNVKWDVSGEEHLENFETVVLRKIPR